MRTSQYLLATLKETPADADESSHDSLPKPRLPLATSRTGTAPCMGRAIVCTPVSPEKATLEEVRRPVIFPGRRDDSVRWERATSALYRISGR